MPGHLPSTIAQRLSWTRTRAMVNRSDSILPCAPLPRSRPHCVSWVKDRTPAQATPPNPPQAPGTTLGVEFSDCVVMGHLGGSRQRSASPGSMRETLRPLIDSSGAARHQLLAQCPPLLPHCSPSQSGDGSPPDSVASECEKVVGLPVDGEDSAYGEPDRDRSIDGRDRSEVNPDRGCAPQPMSSPVIFCKKLQSQRRRTLTQPTLRERIARRREKTAPAAETLSQLLLPQLLRLPFRGPGVVTKGQEEEGRKPRSLSDTHVLAGPRKFSENLQTHNSILRANSDLEKENAHFLVVDMVLEAVEGAKWAVWGQRSAGASPKCADCILENQNQIRNRRSPPVKHSASVASSDSGLETDEHETAADCESSSTLSSSQLPTILCSAEFLALRLVSTFKKEWLAKEDPSLASLCSALQEFLPGDDSLETEDIFSLAREIRQKYRRRATLTWAPPRFQIIFCTHPTQKRSAVVASQDYLCAGCGTRVEAKYLKKLRYCEYLGRYFCDCCHSDAESVIPGHVLEKWDFGRYPVCNFSRRLLESVWRQPLFSLAWVVKNLGSRTRELARFMEFQEQLLAIKKLLTACRLSDRVLQELEQLPGHLMKEPFLLSMDDLQKIRRGQLVSQARALVRTAVTHVDNCQICRARGFICEFCGKEDVLFPFQTAICKCCRECKSCFHIECFRDEDCPKCRRIRTRRTRTDSERDSTLQ